MGYIKRNLLYVDDDPGARALIQAILTQAGYIVETAQDGFEALELIHKFAFDLVLLDIMMPKMSGYEFLKRLRGSEQTKAMPVIMLSHMDDEKTVKKCMDMGANDYLIKPPQRAILMNKLQTILGTRPRFAEISFHSEDHKAKGVVEMSCQILSVGETGLVLKSPVSFLELSQHKLKAPLLDHLGLVSSRLRVVQEQAEGNYFLIYFSYLGLSDAEVTRLRSWVIDEKFKRRSA